MKYALLGRRRAAQFLVCLALGSSLGCEVDNALEASADAGSDAADADADPQAACAARADGETCATGKYCLDGRCRLPRCGDNFVGEDEACDDGNTKSGDGCSTYCTAEYTCGNAEPERGEECDDGNTDNGDGCSARCQKESVCGNGDVEADEECDDGNTKNTDGCSARCTREPSCGDAHIETGEECDDGNTKNADGCSAACRYEICGDARVDGAEQCDDGNTRGGDGCDQACQCEADCGNGHIECAEACDDGNQLNGDGCSRKCEREYCGDDVINNGTEECDNGAANGQQGCSEDCRLACTSCLPACEECRNTAWPPPTAGEKSCPDLLRACYEAEGNAKQGPKAGARSAVLCSELVECIYHSGCAAQRWEDCLCGIGVDPNSAQCALEPQGPCAAEFFASAESEDPLTVKERIVDSRSIAGQAIRLFLLCDAPYCLPSCMLEGCGNGKLEAGEECDDGNRTILHDGCSSTCKLECGDGELQGPLLGGTEECDDGNRTSQDGCSASCKKEGACGDGQLTPPEQCDDQNTTAGDGCDTLCKSEFCGDALINNATAGVPTEECDGSTLPPAAPPGSRCEACKLVLSACGNGTLDAGEECEPPNTVSCDANCQTLTCGNGNVDADNGETCDDGGRVSGDGCTETCILEKCGDGVVNNAVNGQASEECDDGNANTGDGCTPACKREKGSPCEECARQAEKCSYFVDDCLDNAADPTKICKSIIDCVVATHCAETTSEVCYCGSLSIPQCAALDGIGLDGKPAGACKAPIDAGAGFDGSEGPGDKGTKVSERFVDPVYPLGRAFRLVNCERNNCAAECELN